MHATSPFSPRDDVWSVRKYVERHERTLRAYVRDYFPRESFEEHVEDLLEPRNTYLARTIIENYASTEREKWTRIVEFLAHRDSYQVCVLGRKRQGKTTTTWDIIKAVHERTRRSVFAIGAHGSIPPFAAPVSSLSEVPQRSIALWDETAIDANARNSMTRDQRNIPAELAVIGHRKILLFTVVQNTHIGDHSFVTLADAYLVKPLNMAQFSTERGAIVRQLKMWSALLPREPAESLFLSADMAPIQFRRPRPQWWSEDLSHAHRGFADSADAIRYARMLRASGKHWTSIARLMAARGAIADEKTWKRRLEG